ncbi:MAG TPA: response regulator, partial [Marinagarivorans sp.]
QLEPGRGGVGLGLPIVKRLVQALHGHIELRSDNASGTTFICSLPVVMADGFSVPQLQKPQRTHAGYHAEQPVALRRFKVLAVEDDPTSQMILEAVFKKEHIDGVVVGSAEEALEVFKSSTFHLMISDINLPGASGLELIKKIRADQPSLPIIVQSAFAFEQDENRAKDAGATEYLRKPIKYKDIVGVCERYGAYASSASAGVG